MARSSIGRTVAPQAAEAGSIPARVTYDQVVQLADTRRSERRAYGHESSNLSLVTRRIVAGGQ